MRSNIHVDDISSRSKGISLVEMVVIITVLGILAAFAVPRLTHLENDVRAYEIVALSANLRSAAASAHAQYVASGNSASTATLKGRTIHLQNGYPDVGKSGIRLALADLSEFTLSATPTSVTYSKIGAPVAAQCAVTYHAAPAASSEATITDLNTKGC
jgi:MSHA pilin protein MshA